MPLLMRWSPPRCVLIQKLLSQFEPRAVLYMRTAGPTTHEGKNTQKVKSSKRERIQKSSQQQTKMQTHARCTKRKKHIAKKRRKEKSLWGAFVAQREKLEGAKLLLRYFILSICCKREKMSQCAPGMA